MARPKKRGPKPGAKRRPYKKQGNVIRLYSIADEMDAALVNLEKRMRAITTRINKLMRV